MKFTRRGKFTPG